MVLEYRAEWTGFTGGPGVSVFHARPASGTTDAEAAQSLANRVVGFLTDAAIFMPNDVTIEFPTEVVELNTTTGALEDVYTVTSGADVVGGSDGEYAAPVGMRVDWGTAAIVAGRRLRGRTFIVPTAASVFGTSGAVEPDNRTQLAGYAAEYFAPEFFEDGVPVVWSRTHGILADITSGSVPSKAAILSSRRD